MKLKKPVLSALPQVPDELKEKFEIVADYPLIDREAMLFNLLLQNIVKELNKDKVDFKKLHRVTAIITKEGEFTLTLDNNYIMGSRVCLVVYAVERWRRNGYADNQIMTILAEELCHHYWNIEDEVMVKHKVYNVIKDIFPGSKFEQFYNI